MNFRTFAAVLFAALLVATPMNAAAATGPPLDYSSEKAPNPYFTEDTLTIASHDRADMTSVLEYEDDNGDVQTLPATHNESLTHEVGVRPDKIEADAYQLFPRVSGESENAHTWLNTSNWTTEGANSSKLSVTDSDGSTASGVPSVQVATDGSMSSGDTATANFSTEVDITSDVNKRVLLWVGSVNTLDSGANASLRVEDGDGDYKAAYIDDSLNANDTNVIANATGNGIVYQVRLSDLTVEGSGDGTLDAIKYVKVVTDDADADITTAGLDVETKSMLDFGDHAYDSDGDGDVHDEDPTSVDNWTTNTDGGAGVLKLTGLDSMGSAFDNAVVHDLEVYEVEYRAQDLTDSDDWDVEFSSADNYGSYPQKLEVYYRLSVPTAIDLSHGTLSLNDTQGLVNERYQTVEIAEDTGDTVFENISDSDWTDKSDLYTSKDDEHQLDSSVTAGDNYVVHMMVLLQDGEASALQASAAMGGPTGKSGGGFFSTVWGQITGIAGAIIAFVAGSRKLGGN